MEKEMIAKITRIARERGYSWKEIARYFGLSKERIIQISGFKIPERMRKDVLNRADGQCELCHKKAEKLFVARLDSEKGFEEGNIVALDKQCFYDQNVSDKVSGYSAQRKRMAVDYKALMSQIADEIKAAEEPKQ